MDRCRITLAVAASAAVALLSACSSTTSGTPTDAGSAGAGRSPASTSAANTPDSLASILRQGLSSTRSAHITLRVTTSGQTITGQGDETLVSGKVRGVTLTETIPGVGSLQIIQLDGKTYVKLPTNLTKLGKPWALVTTTSSDPTVRILANTLQSAQSSAVDAAGIFASAAKSITNRGPATVGGVQTTHYYVVVDVAKLPAGYIGRDELIKAGVATLPIDLYVDSAGRPVQLTERLTVSGTSVSTVFGVTKYNQPVTITAPPASQVSDR